MPFFSPEIKSDIVSIGITMPYQWSESPHTGENHKKISGIVIKISFFEKKIGENTVFPNFPMIFPSAIRVNEASFI